MSTPRPRTPPRAVASIAARYSDLTYHEVRKHSETLAARRSASRVPVIDSSAMKSPSAVRPIPSTHRTDAGTPTAKKTKTPLTDEYGQRIPLSKRSTPVRHYDFVATITAQQEEQWEQLKQEQHLLEGRNKRLGPRDAEEVDAELQDRTNPFTFKPKINDYPKMSRESYETIHDSLFERGRVHQERRLNNSNEHALLEMKREWDFMRFVDSRDPRIGPNLVRCLKWDRSTSTQPNEHRSHSVEALIKNRIASRSPYRKKLDDLESNNRSEMHRKATLGRIQRTPSMLVREDKRREKSQSEQPRSSTLLRPTAQSQQRKNDTASAKRQQRASSAKPVRQTASPAPQSTDSKSADKQQDGQGTTTQKSSARRSQSARPPPKNQDPAKKTKASSRSSSKTKPEKKQEGGKPAAGGEQKAEEKSTKEEKGAKEEQGGGETQAEGAAPTETEQAGKDEQNEEQKEDEKVDSKQEETTDSTKEEPATGQQGTDAATTDAANEESKDSVQEEPAKQASEDPSS